MAYGKNYHQLIVIPERGYNYTPSSIVRICGATNCISSSVLRSDKQHKLA